ncbi:hypothetical protein [Roseibium alexandrii]|uniref:GIY-YIG domain-containing protein n=1 Tax=Roseibium alexandrii (strain DSM 17067 / NCIMB 14079 / DFL-11) TaxID=244592 RepID=A0A5E8H0K5_ROSAD|nr:hypothetical protein [Roseibium alexandrii]EEE45447.2 hypothetical protein SADFL11_2736 [Roseibium alexandrii DFL-11]
MTVGTYTLTLPGPMLRRGFWLYVWRIIVPDGRELLYVGRTGDNSSPHASPVYIRMGQHLGSAKNTNALRKHLTEHGIAPEDCVEFDMVAHGPIYAEVEKPADYNHDDKEIRATLMKQHLPIRDIVGAMEKRLADDLSAANYVVMNEVKWKPTISDEDWHPIRTAFAEKFPKLKMI